MADIKEFVNIQISRETEAVKVANFGIPGFIASHTAFSERAREYTSIEGVAEDFLSTSAVYAAALSYFGQQKQPERIVIGRRQINSVTGSISSVTNNAQYTVTINGVNYSYTSDATATAIEICAGLDTAVGALAGINFTAVGDGTFTVGVATPGTAWSLKSSSNISLTNVASTETWADAITAVRAVNDEWYLASNDDKSDAGIAAFAAAIQSMKKMYITSSDDANILSSSTSDIGSTQKALSRDRTAILYSGTADTTYPEAGWVSSAGLDVPGSNTWAFKTISGTSVDKNTATQFGYAKSKNVNTYESTGGVNRTTNGITVGGEWIDVMITVDWTEARMKEALWYVMANSKKVPFTRKGAALIEAQIRKIWADGVANGAFDGDKQPIIRIPDPATIAPSTKATRVFDGIQFTFYLAGAIHKIGINGTVAY